MSIDNLRKLLRDELSVMYRKNDTAHQEAHFEEVYATGVELMGYHGLGYRKELLLITAYVHDLFAWDRPVHHDLSGDWVRDGKLPTVIQDHLSMVEVALLECACREHRASYKGEFTNGFSELFNSADFGRPVDVASMLARAVDFRLSRGDSTEDAVRGGMVHLVEKYGTRGYARYPDMYLSLYGDQIRDLEQEVQLLSVMVDWDLVDAKERARDPGLIDIHAFSR